MDNPTVEERIRMIQKDNIPHVVQPHNTIPHGDYIPVCYLDDVIPEVIIPKDSEGNPFTGRSEVTNDYRSYIFQSKWPEWDKAVAIAGDAISVMEPKDLFPIYDPTGQGGERRSLPSIETHAFYDSERDMTHYFVLAARWLVEKKRKELGGMR